MEKSFAVIEDMSRKSFGTSTIAYTAAMAACSDADEWQTALALLKDMDDAQCPLDAVTFGAVIAACGWDQALSLLASMEDQNIRRNLITLNAALHACEKSCNWKHALQVFHDFDHALVERDVITFHSTMLACKGAWLHVLELFSSLEASKVEANALTYAILADCQVGTTQTASLAALASIGLGTVKSKRCCHLYEPRSKYAII